MYLWDLRLPRVLYFKTAVYLFADRRFYLTNTQRMCITVVEINMQNILLCYLR